MDSEEVRETEADLVANLPWKLKNKGLRDVVITLRCGVTIVVRIPYYVGKKKHKKRGSGLYPGLVILSINDHCTPGLASEIAMTVSAMDSFEEAQANLSQRGIFLNVKTIKNIVYKWAQRTRLIQKSGTVVYDVSLRGSARSHIYRWRPHSNPKKQTRQKPVPYKVARAKAFDYLRYKRRRSQRSYICPIY